MSLKLLPAVCALCLVLAAPANASRTQAMTFEAPRDLDDPAMRSNALDEIRSFGVHELRVIVHWSDVAPGSDSATKPSFDAASPAGYDWSKYDSIMSEARQRGFSVLMTISGPAPKWATKAKLDNVTRPNPSDFQDFVTAVGRHYGDQVGLWSIWNEPNQPQFLRPQFADGGKAVSPIIYRHLYQAARKGLDAAGQQGDKVLIAETSPRGTSTVVAPLTFMRGMLCLNSHYHKRKSCAELPADGYAHHAYTTRQGPYFVPHNHNDVTIGVLSRLTRAIDKAARAKALPRHLPVYLTEFGIQSLPDTQSGVSLANQVLFRSIAERIAYFNPRVVSFSQYLLTDSQPTGPHEYGGFESGLRFADGKAKPSLESFPLPMAVQRVGHTRVSIWGLVRPATGVTTATVLYANHGSHAYHRLKTVKTDSRGYVRLRSTYRSGRRWRLEWQGRESYPVKAYSKR